MGEHRLTIATGPRYDMAYRMPGTASQEGGDEPEVM
jgi:hypothetical protein